MIALEVRRNGERVCLAGVPDGVLNAIVGYLSADDEPPHLTLSVGGLHDEHHRGAGGVVFGIVNHSLGVISGLLVGASLFRGRSTRTSRRVVALVLTGAITIAALAIGTARSPSNSRLHPKSERARSHSHPYHEYYVVLEGEGALEVDEA